MLLKGEAVLLHEPENPLSVDGRFSLLAPLPVQQCREAPIAIGGPLVDDRTQFGKKGNILGLAITASMPWRLTGAFDQVGLGDAQSSGNGAQWV